jgi:hypothetical protein
MNIKIFSPIGIKPEDYRHRYPELDRTPEFEGIHPRGLMFIWWYANQSSDLVLYTHDDYERVKEALSRSGYAPTKIEKEKILSLQFDSNFAVAIRKMASFDPGARFKAYMMIKKIYDQYQFIIDQGPSAFMEKVTKGEGEDKTVTEEIDYKKYVDISAKIAGELSGLLTKMEEGFAIVNISGEEIKDNESTALRDWHMKKEN